MPYVSEKWGVLYPTPISVWGGGRVRVPPGGTRTPRTPYILHLCVDLLYSISWRTRTIRKRIKESGVWPL